MLKDAKIIVSIFNTFKQGSAVIAGGCLRDLETHRDPKDIDILVEWESEVDYREASILADRLGYKLQDCNDTYEDNTEEQLRTVFKLTKIGKKPIDIIFLNCTVMERIENFPCNAVMVWLEGDVIRSNDKYAQFMNTGKLEFYNRATDEYKARLQSYYPEV